MNKPILAHRGFWFAAGLSAATAAIDLIGGVSLEASEASLISLAPLLVALPAMYAVTGNFSSIIAAHLSDPEIYPARMRRLMLALLLGVPLSALGVTFISLLVAYFQHYALTKPLIIHYLLFYVVSLVALIFLVFVASYVGNKLLQKSRINSDDVLINVMSNTSPVVMLLGLALAAHFYF